MHQFRTWLLSRIYSHYRWYSYYFSHIILDTILWHIFLDCFINSNFLLANLLSFHSMKHDLKYRSSESRSTVNDIFPNPGLLCSSCWAKHDIFSFRTELAYQIENHHASCLLCYMHKESGNYACWKVNIEKMTFVLERFLYHHPFTEVCQWGFYWNPVNVYACGTLHYWRIRLGFFYKLLLVCSVMAIGWRLRSIGIW